jgi:hypothetical protein
MRQATTVAAIAVSQKSRCQPLKHGIASRRSTSCMMLQEMIQNHSRMRHLAMCMVYQVAASILQLTCLNLDFCSPYFAMSWWHMLSVKMEYEF